ncbi:B-cell lymphoma 3 protein isoform X2 [Cynoglossus semilaevis]|uniref:BCL3 transcription coactivator n=1 Tax=Cynoglossus semilaevis TaxID=244447 RepID=A0A3P8WB33_CYNSE|nr:B-cell lymphoma 3 protein isoform X2 [Cynoglossus semilaevis]
MPTLETMNDGHHPVATVPLDLRTINRKRCGSPECAVPQRSQLEQRHLPVARSRTVGVDVDTSALDPNRGAPASDTCVTRKRPADKNSLKLPFRKRQFLVETEAQPAQVYSAETNRKTPAEPESVRATDLTAGNSWLRDGGESRIGAASLTPRTCQNTGASEDRIHFSHLHPVNYGQYHLATVVEPNRSLPHQTDNQSADLALATRQDEDGDTALHIAVVQSEMPFVQMQIRILLSARRNLDIYNNLHQTPLHLAVITQQANMVYILLRAGADPAVLDRNGQTALHLCCEYNLPECVAVVLSHSLYPLSLETRNFEGLSPLHLAVLRGQKDIAKRLLDAGADINAMDIKSGQSPLMHAVEKNNADMVCFLIENGSDVNRQSYSGNTALHAACGRGQVEIVRLLLKSGADSSLKNYHNDTPVMVATNKKIADVLRGRGAKYARVQEQHCVPVSPHSSRFSESGSPYPSPSRGCSPLAAPPTPQRSKPHSPKTSPGLVFPYS